MTKCTEPAIEFQGLGRRKIRVDFEGGNVSSDGGGLLLREVERKRGWIRGLGECCTDTRSPAWVEHPVPSLLAQRIFGLALGYEDLNDHEHLLCALLRPSNIDASAGALDQIKRIVKQLREVWPEVNVLLRADSGFARDEIMSWCEEHRVDYLFGLARNARLETFLSPALESAKRWQQVVGGSVRTFMELRYRTQKSWSRARRVIGKAEVSAQGSNPRFVVTSLTARAVGARELYEQTYCARGDMENRIKEQQLDLFADRTSTAVMKSNQLRLWFSAIAYSLINDLRTLGLKGTRMGRSTCGTIRERLLKIGAVIRVSVRRVVIHLATGCAWQDVFTQAFHRLCPACINTS